MSFSTRSRNFLLFGRAKIGAKANPGQRLLRGLEFCSSFSSLILSLPFSVAGLWATSDKGSDSNKRKSVSFPAALLCA